MGVRKKGEGGNIKYRKGKRHLHKCTKIKVKKDTPIEQIEHRRHASDKRVLRKMRNKYREKISKFYVRKRHII